MQIQRVVSRTETYTTQETRTGTRSDGAGGTETYSYTEDVQRLRVVNDVVTEEVPDPVPPQDKLLEEQDWAAEELAEPEEPEEPVDPMTGEEAIRVLDRDFEVFDGAGAFIGWTDGKVSERDLRVVAENADDKFTAEQQEAAQVLLDSPTYRNFLDVGTDDGVDGIITREGVDSAVAAIASGSYLDELFDTAAGLGGRDGYIGGADVRAVLADPGLPQEMKDALSLILESSEAGEDLHAVIGALDASEIADASALMQTPAYAALSDAQRRLVADAFRDSGGAAAAELRTLLESPEFQAGGAAEQEAALSRVALLNSTEFAALPTSDQDLIRATLAGADVADLAVAGDLLSLIQNPNFAGLPADTQTAILSQASNYPDSRAVANLERMVDQQWFRDQDLADQQRSAKLVAHMSADDTGDRDIIENTLDRFLAPDADYKLRWLPIAADPGNVTLGYASGDTLTLNEDLVPADNNPVGTGMDARVIENTSAHEVSHLVNGDTPSQTFEYLNEEYRAWYVGYEAQNGRPPSNQEAMDRWEYFLNPGGGYADYAQGITGGGPGGADIPGALDKPEEAEQIFALLSELSGLEVTDANYLAVMADPSTWTTTPSDPASDDVFPATDDLDN